jgi:hypothetical protein
MSTVTMQELELETAELLPARETLWVCKTTPQSSSSTTVVQTGQGDVIGNGNYDQHGLIPIQIDNNNVAVSILSVP